MKRILGYAGLFLGTLAADLATKQLVRTFMHVGESVRVAGEVVKFTFIYNRNAVFGLPVGNRVLYTVFAFVAVLLIVIYFIRLPAAQRWERAALAVILGGALGNLADRVRTGQVVDFIEVGYRRFTWPVFNLADLAITIGMVMLIIPILFRKPELRGPRNPDPGAAVGPGTAAG